MGPARSCSDREVVTVRRGLYHRVFLVFKWEIPPFESRARQRIPPLLDGHQIAYSDPMSQPILCLGRLSVVGFLLVPTLLSSLSACVALDEFAERTTVRMSCSPSAPLPIPANRTIPITYTEPRLQQNGQELAFMSHTTIYYDAGRGVREYTKHSATKVTGGGPVARDVIIPDDAGNNPTAKICVTATNSAGEGPPAFIEAASGPTP